MPCRSPRLQERRNISPPPPYEAKVTPGLMQVLVNISLLLLAPEHTLLHALLFCHNGKSAKPEINLTAWPGGLYLVYFVVNCRGLTD